MIIARKNKLQPYFPLSLIYKAFSIAICLLVFHWKVFHGKVCQAQRGRKKGLIILYLSLVLLFPYTSMEDVEFACNQNFFCILLFTSVWLFLYLQGQRACYFARLKCRDANECTPLDGAEHTAVLQETTQPKRMNFSLAA